MATVPVIYAASGNCHVYVDASADLDAAEAIALNAKLQRPGVCNAAETLLVHEQAAAAFLPRGAGRADRSRRDPPWGRASPGGGARGPVLPRAEEDWDTEYLALEMAVGVVDSHRRRRSTTSTRTARGTPRRS